jgi:hypothetical protein
MAFSSKKLLLFCYFVDDVAVFASCLKRSSLGLSPELLRFLGRFAADLFSVDDDSACSPRGRPPRLFSKLEKDAKRSLNPGSFKGARDPPRSCLASASNYSSY